MAGHTGLVGNFPSGVKIFRLIERLSSEADFSSNLVKVYSVSSEKDYDLPRTRAPVRFAVLMKDGGVSNSWGVSVRDTGDAYIFCRDSMRGQKVSLHCSGKQHVSFDESVTKLPNFSGSRFMNQWREPEFEDHAIPTFAILFPNWGTRLGDAVVSASETKWKKNELFIVGHETEVTAVSFYIVDEHRRMVYRGDRSVIRLCKLPLRLGKTLHVFAERQLEGDLVPLIREKAFPSAAASFAAQGAHSGLYRMCVTGERGETRWMVPFSVDYKSPEK